MEEGIEENNIISEDVDICDITTVINYGLSLDLKDFGGQFLDEQLPLKKVPVNF
jgi:hypothetical protein